MSGQYAGIDYAGFGSKVNRDEKTGIRYGVISQHSIQPEVMSDIWDSARDLSYESVVDDLKDRIVSAIEQGETAREALAGVLDDFVRNADLSDPIDQMLDMIKDNDDKTPHRDMLWDVVEQDFNDRYESGDSHDWLWEKEGYRLESCLNYDVFVSKSPYYTYAQFCSPCVPGAGNLGNAYEGLEVGPDGYPAFGETFAFFAEAAGFPKVLCLGHDFFEGEKAPYRVFDVVTGKLVPPPNEEAPNNPDPGAVQP